MLLKTMSCKNNLTVIISKARKKLVFLNVKALLISSLDDIFNKYDKEYSLQSFFFSSLFRFYRFDAYKFRVELSADSFLNWYAFSWRER